MPEGDTLRRAAARIGPVLDGATATTLWFRKLKGHRPQVGQRVEAVEAVGKHLLVHFDRRLTLRTHLGMAGWWRALAPDVPVAPDPRLRIVIGTERGTALCYAAPVIDTFVRDRDESPVGHLGPDLSEDVVDLDAVVARARRTQHDTLAELLLDQRVAGGIGNVFKSEVLFLAGVHPFTAPATLDDAALRTVYDIAHRQLVANRSRAIRTTTAPGVPGRTYVYRRHRAGCRRCGDAVRFSPAGTVTERSTYWCPTCQGR